MNELRVPLITDALGDVRTAGNDKGPQKMLSGIKMIDVGCGGGLLTEVFHPTIHREGLFEKNA